MKNFRRLMSSHRRGAFTLIEMVIIVLLLAVFSLILTELFTVSIRAQGEAHKRDTLLHRLDSAITYLRRDVWSATSIVADGAQAQLPAAKGPVVLWRYTADGKLLRQTDPPTTEQSWGDLPPVAFSAHGPLLTLTLKAVGRDESVTFVSEQMQAGGK